MRVTEFFKTFIDLFFYWSKIDNKFLYYASIISTCITDHMITTVNIMSNEIFDSVKHTLTYNTIDVSLLNKYCKPFIIQLSIVRQSA